jgi:hypothetical protein
MICIFCGSERTPSLEHVLPRAIGGTITTTRVCTACNSDFGSRIDSAVSNFMPIRSRRAQLKLAGHSGAVPDWFEMFLGEGKMVGPDEHRVRTWFNRATGQLETEQLFHAKEYVREDGQADMRFTIDARHRADIPKILQRERSRRGLRPLTDEELAKIDQQLTINTVEQPVIKRSISVSFAYLRHAMLKIAYELAFLWLGEDYLCDPVAHLLRAAISDRDIASTDAIPGYINVAQGCPAFQNWSSDGSHHLAYALALPNRQIVVAVRIFDIYAAAVPVTSDAQRYLRSRSDREKLRFLAIDAPSGQTIDTSHDDEVRRMGGLMAQLRILPPVPDPLATTIS